ncbi:DUF2512 family protein [Aneurinibacillus sp. Ricciae_BoGa-3]|uniref:DUF2512 family protein n=1 Tax=Aneurinibacillus sp. Ricciae_BoGa-3 TaxID=3022697 RepID=UPI0023400650|nr:DUF2512 family protein [Aneurinibacillus sp. Ricciae_BoGa-3]WCK52791.1 DUF2512 family protein [Aneurinibacillus sp. Ricciae_BoGa-3]
MKHIKAFIIKFLRFLFDIYIFIGLVYDQPFSIVFELSLVLSLISYILGDLILLPTLGINSATAADFVIIALGIWLGMLAYGVNVHIFVYVLLALFLTVEEFVYHVYVQNKIFNKKSTVKGKLDKLYD